jgi:hypothetical protein
MMSVISAMMKAMTGDRQSNPTTDEVNRTVTAVHMFRGSRDFFLAYELLGAFLESSEVRQGRAPAPIQSQATCAALALELALKARIVLGGGSPPSKGPDGHKYVAMFNLLPRAAQEDVASFLHVDAHPATVEGLVRSLKEFEGTFQRWRYMHEHTEIAFHEGNMVAVIRAVCRSIVRLRPDFGPWPGVIVDPSRPVPWHLTPP